MPKVLVIPVQAWQGAKKCPMTLDNKACIDKGLFDSESLNMTVEDFLKRALSQRPVTVQRMVGVPGPTLRALLAEGKPMLISEIQSHPDQKQEMRTYRYGHLLGPGLQPSDIEAWQRNYTGYTLPSDLMRFLTFANGIHLWADLDSSLAYFGISPLNEWQDAGNVNWATMFDSPPMGKLVISYHENGDNFLVLDTQRQAYLWFDLEDFDQPKHAGSTIAELLDFWWKETAWLDPRQEAAVV
ncbi:MAG TPA: SMI1/KNR4 family protein [Gemmataceae bacterium]|nr:SMI1/KNR4 family protein [Gemmataceae bacterium]